MAPKVRHEHLVRNVHGNGRGHPSPTGIYSSRIYATRRFLIPCPQRGWM